MIVPCRRCGRRFHLNTGRVRETGSKVRCSYCKHVFLVYPPGAHPPEPKLRDETAEDRRIHERPFTEVPLIQVSESRDKAPAAKESPKPPQSPPVPEASDVDVDVEADAEKIQGKYTPFKRKLIYFAAILIGLIAVVVIPIEAYRPYMELHQLIDDAKNLLSGVEAAFDPGDVARMNRFALETIAETDTEAVSPTPYHALAYNMLLLEGTVLPEKDVREKQELISYFKSERIDYDHDDLLSAAAYWRGRFADDPGIYDILRKFKQSLIRAKQNAARAGFKLSYFMIMLDSGEKEGFFEDQVAFLLESTQWWTYPTYAGQPYKVTSGTWRDLALEGKNAFGHSAVYDPDNFFLPHFVTDEYGAWFSVWMTQQSGEYYNNYSIDFDATEVKNLVMIVGVSVGMMILILAAITVIITRFLSEEVTRPITELTVGAREVANANYDYQVPILKNDEFSSLITQFNAMTRGQKERLNLMQTLEKFLSRDLAKQAASQGIILGGQKADCTVMFTDFAGFSTITQKMTASEAVNILNSYFSGLIPIIKKYGGFPDKYIGDAIVAMFGAPVEFKDHAARAVMCAIEMQWKMREMNDQRRRDGKTVFEMRIGLNSGEVLVGAIGCDMKLEYTSIGETTNLANRMESICEIGHIMIAEGAYNQIRNTFFRGVDIERTPQQIQVKGYPEPVSCYRIFVDNLKIEKDLYADGPIKSFYIYTEEKHDLRQSPDEVTKVEFTSVAEFIK